MGSSYIGPYVVNDKLGKGLFGKSRNCSTIDNCPIAIKVIETLPVIKQQKLIADVTAFYINLTKTGNPKERYPLLRFREVMEMDDRCFAIISEYSPQGNLGQHLLVKKELHLTLLEMKQIAQGVEWLHRQRITHGDLKPNNILLKEGQLIIADVLPPAFRGCLRLRELDGAYDYFAPELHSGTLTPPASDIWSLGVIFLEMFYGRRIRNLSESKLGLRPSMNDNYPSASILAAVTHPDLQSLLRLMLGATPFDRIDIRQVISRLQEMTDMHLQTRRRVVLREQALDQRDNTHALPIMLTFDNSTPYSRHFSVAGNKVTRIDQEKMRVQAVSRQKIPFGIWSISVAVVNYGTWNDEVAIGFTTEERRYQRMSGDIDQAGCIAFWSSFANRKSNICLNGEWNDESLPFLREGMSILQTTVNMEERSIYWYVDSQWVKQTPMPRYFWDQSLFFFVGLMGKNCSVELLQSKNYQ